MIRPIVHWPAPILARRAGKFTAFGETSVNLATDLSETLAAADGYGLAAPQIGFATRAIVVDLLARSRGAIRDGRPKRDLVVMFNPEVLWISPEFEADEEGCLSIPSVWLSVPRPRKLHLRWQDQAGKTLEGDASGWSARAIQHEIDHLHGITLAKWMTPLGRAKARQQVRTFLGRQPATNREARP